MDLYRKRMLSEKKKTPAVKKTTPGRKKKTLSTTPSSDQTEQLRRYLVKKTFGGLEDKKKNDDQEDTGRAPNNVEDNAEIRRSNIRKTTDVVSDTAKVQELRKLTFTPGHNRKVKDNITMFQKLSDGVECVIGSGMCAGHNVKLIRNVKMKRCSDIDERGLVTWSMREVTTLTCPAATRQGSHSAQSAVMLELSDETGTNGKQRKLRRMCDDQPQAGIQDREGDTDIRLEG